MITATLKTNELFQSPPTVSKLTRLMEEDLSLKRMVRGIKRECDLCPLFYVYIKDKSRMYLINFQSDFSYPKSRPPHKSVLSLGVSGI